MFEAQITFHDWCYQTCVLKFFLEIFVTILFSPPSVLSLLKPGSNLRTKTAPKSRSRSEGGGGLPDYSYYSLANRTFLTFRSPPPPRLSLIRCLPSSRRDVLCVTKLLEWGGTVTKLLEWGTVRASLRSEKKKRENTAGNIDGFRYIEEFSLFRTEVKS